MEPMTNSPFTPGIASGRLDAEALDQNFADLHPPLDGHEALVAADRCYFCHDAPCITACPTSIDIPLFIRQIATGTPEAAAKTIFDQNILGGMCARVCPTETLCEEACVREVAEGKPVLIGQLQRYATDTLMEAGVHPYQRAAPTGKKVAVVGAGPAGLACAHRLAMHGHDVTIFEARPKGGGPERIRDRLLQDRRRLRRGGGRLAAEDRRHHDRDRQGAGPDLTLAGLREDFDAVFLGMGLSGVNALAPMARRARASRMRSSSSRTCGRRAILARCRWAAMSW
jgi:dihydropyrimidine dehydrogenase (NAD+) subunit PreT